RLTGVAAPEATRVGRERGVRLDAVVLDHPLGVEAVQAVLRRRDVAAVEQAPEAADAAHAAPGALADPRSEPVLAEVEREDVAVRRRVLVDETLIGAGDELRRDRGGAAPAVGGAADQDAAQPIQRDLMDAAAG